MDVPRLQADIETPNPTQTKRKYDKEKRKLAQRRNAGADANASAKIARVNGVQVRTRQRWSERIGSESS